MPLEIFETVFGLVRGEENDDSFFLRLPQDHEWTPKPLSWIAISHVCQHWRECALGIKRLWRVIQIGEQTKYPGALATNFLERSKPLHVTLYHSTYDASQLDAEEISLLNDFYNRLAENRDRIARIFLWGTFHETAWRLLHQDLPNIVETVISTESTPYIYGNSLDKRTPSRAEPQFKGRAWNLEKLALLGPMWALNSYSNLTHLFVIDNYIRDGKEGWILEVLSSLSNTLRVLCLHDACLRHSELARGLTSDRVRLPYLKYIEIRSDEDEYEEDGPQTECDLSILHCLSLPSSTSVVWTTNGIRDGESIEMDPNMFPPREYRDRVQDVVISCGREDCFLMKGSTIFSPSKDIQSYTIYTLCTGFPNVTSISLPSSWLGPQCEGDPSELAELIQKLDNFQLKVEFYHSFVPALSDVHIYTGESDDIVLKEDMRQSISKSLIEMKLPALDFSGDFSMSRRREDLDKVFTLHFHPGDIKIQQVVLPE